MQLFVLYNNNESTNIYLLNDVLAHRWRIFLFVLPLFFAELTLALCLALLLGVDVSFVSVCFVLGVLGRSATQKFSINIYSKVELAEYFWFSNLTQCLLIFARLVMAHIVRCCRLVSVGCRITAGRSRQRSHDGIVAGILIRQLRLAVSLGLWIARLHQFADRRHRCDRRLGKQSFGFFELAVPFVGLWICTFVGCQISIPSSDDISVQLGVLQIRTFKCVYLTF